MDTLDESIIEMATDLHDAGIMNKVTLNKIKKDILPQKKCFDAAAVRKIRELSGVSQAVFARYMGVCASTVHKWESGSKKPTGTASRLLDVIEQKGLDILR